jgi:hypothetical protein
MAAEENGAQGRNRRHRDFQSRAARLAKCLMFQGIIEVRIKTVIFPKRSC